MQQPPIYDLYAVINHYGGMIGGHYTAYARLPSAQNSQRSDVGEWLTEIGFTLVYTKNTTNSQCILRPGEGYSDHLLNQLKSVSMKGRRQVKEGFLILET
jgi:hypothetical protein